MAGAAAEAKALRLLIERAERGDLDAQGRLGARYEKGNSEVQD